MTPEALFVEQLRHLATATPDKAFLRDECTSIGYAEAHKLVLQRAATLVAGGLKTGDRCIVFMENGLEYVLAWLALSRLGVTSVPLNQALKGPLLAHQVRDVAARGVIADPTHWGKLAMLDGVPSGFECVFVSGSNSPNGESSFPPHTMDLQAIPDVALENRPLPKPSAVLSIFYTSGTTGPSKGVSYTHLQGWQTGQTVAQYLDDSDVFYMTNPMCHVSLPHCLGAALLCGGTLAVRARFSAGAFWDDIRRYRATVTMMLGSVASFVTAIPESDLDRDHSLRKVLMVPVLKNVEQFCRRFDVSVMSWFNMTEVSVPIHTDGFSKTPSLDCGTTRYGAVARIADEFDEEVPLGAPGELLLRDEAPWKISPGYINNLEATLASWRNQWFHTGDLFVRETDGKYRFLDRMKDCIRRRGENISSYEVEAQALTHPSVKEAAVVGVDCADGEQEVKLIAVLHADAVLTPSELLDFLQERLPHFCVPRFVLLQEKTLPRTETGKVMKQPLRDKESQLGWDREQYGYKVRR